MNEGAIKKLKYRFIRMAMITLVATMLILSGMIYVGVTIVNRQAIQTTLSYIVKNDGELLAWSAYTDDNADSLSTRIMEQLFFTNYDVESPEFTFTTRYFAVHVDADGQIQDIHNGYIRALTQEQIEAYALEAVSHGSGFGQMDDYSYQVELRDDGTALVVFLNSGSVIRSNSRLRNLALILIAFSMVVAFFIVRALATPAVRVEIRNAEIQKQFMTNASHELKTPLAVIRANTEMVEMLNGESEWTTSTLRQVERMNGLIQNLVMISRADEQNNFQDNEDVDATKAIEETVGNFQALALSNGLQLSTAIAQNVHIQGDNAQLRQLCSLLVDNAIKYCDPNGEIRVEMQPKGKGLMLTVSNDYAEGKNVDYSRFFERFYRQDESHNVDRGGYGIGLSIAESLTRQYHGSIAADWKQGKISFVCHLKARG